jgi:hypothetical protein
MKKSMEKMSKNTKIALGAIILVIIVALIVRGSLHKKNNSVTPTPEPVIEQPKAPVSKGIKPKVENPVPVDTRGYTELVEAYKNKMLQFGDSCQVHTSNQVYKIGSEILLDNRNNMSLDIKIGNNSYALGAYGYKVVALNTEGKLMVNCNGHTNVATLTVQN